MKRMVIAFGCDDMEYRTTVEMSKKWGISERRIARLCAEKRINGVMKIGRAWAIPDNAKKPSARVFIQVNIARGVLKRGITLWFVSCLN